MLRALTDEGLLPTGVHLAQLAEVVSRFGTGTPQREEVTKRLEMVLGLARRTNKVRRVFIWGSYVTAKLEPNDVDILLVMAADFLPEHDDAEVSQVFDAEAAEKQLGASVLWVREDLPDQLLRDILEQWQIDREGRTHGIVEVTL